MESRFELQAVITGFATAAFPVAKKTCAKTGRTALEQPVQQKGANQMRIAVTYENGNVFQHFGHTSQFKIYDIENGQVVNQQIVDTNGQGHGALAGFLADAKVDVLICGGIGGGAQAALREAGIRLFGGVSGSADSAVSAYLADALQFDANVHCNHHEHDHSCGGTCLPRREAWLFRQQRRLPLSGGCSSYIKKRGRCKCSAFAPAPFAPWSFQPVSRLKRFTAGIGPYPPR